MTPQQKEDVRQPSYESHNLVSRSVGSNCSLYAMSFTPSSTASPADSSQQLSTGKQENEYNSESRQALASAPLQTTTRGKKRTGLIVTLTLIAVIIVFLAVFLPVYLVVVRKHKSSTSVATSSGGGSGVSNPDSTTGAVVSLPLVNQSIFN